MAKITVCCEVHYQPYTDDPTYPITIRTEIFALESALYEIWTGRKPYQDKSDEDVIRCFRDSQFPDVEIYRPQVSYRNAGVGHTQMPRR